jgi:CO dehydrogenase nickel-insertion accessory protein CooC1
MEKENNNLRKFLENIGIFKIFVDNVNTISEIIKSIEYENIEINENANLSLEIEKLKQIIKENAYPKQENETNKEIKVDASKNFKNKVIAIAGNYGSGKSLVTTILGKTFKKYNISTIIVDFDIINSSINMLFRVPKYNNDYNVITNPEQCIRKISNKLDVFCGIDLLFNEENKIDYEKVKNLFEFLKIKYDLILIDTSSETTLKYIKTVLLNVDKIIFLLEPSILEIKKAENLLEIYIEDWGIPINKFKILLNKVNSNSIDEDILKNIFNKIEFIGKLSFSSHYTAFSNNVRKEILNYNKYMKILNKI